MHRLLRTSALLIALIVLSAPNNSSVTASEWRWAKPLNEKVGSFFYTSNQRFKQSDFHKARSQSKTQTRSYHRSRDLRRPAFNFRGMKKRR